MAALYHYNRWSTKKLKNALKDMWHSPSTHIPLSIGVWAAMLKGTLRLKPLDECIKPKCDYMNSQLMQRIIRIVLWCIAEGPYRPSIQPSSQVTWYCQRSTMTTASLYRGYSHKHEGCINSSVIYCEKEKQKFFLKGAGNTSSWCILPKCTVTVQQIIS